MEDELNDLVTPLGNAKNCAALMQRFEDENLSETDRRTQTGGVDAVADVAKTIIRLNAMEAELRRNGCPLNKGFESKSVESVMTPSDTPASPAMTPPIDPKSYGKPMVDSLGRPVER